LTWGPYGATFGWGDEIGAILKLVHSNDPNLLPQMFGEDFDVLWNTVASPASECVDLLAPVYADPQKREAWKVNFQKLGERPEVIEAYEELFWSRGYLGGKLRKLYSGLFPPDGPRQPTEIDFAFLVDLSMHASVTNTRVRNSVAAIAAKEAETGQPVSSAKARQFVGEVFVAAIAQITEKKPRRGRNVSYYVDGLGEEALSADELEAWKYKGSRRASAFGLSDERIYKPEFLAPEMTNK
jgi:hypothetical protein